MKDLEHAYQQLYDSLAERYDNLAEVPRLIADDLLNRLVWVTLSPDVVIDLGAGTGYCAQKLKTFYPEAAVLSLDLSEAMLRAGNPPGQIVASASALPFLPNSVDLVISHLMLDVYSDLTGIFSEIQRVLRPEGFFLFTALGRGSFPELALSAGRIDTHTHVNTFLHPPQIATELTQAEFLDPVIDVEPYQIGYDSWKTLMRDLKGLGSVHWEATRRKSLLTPRQLSQWKAAYSEFKAQDDSLPVTLEVIYGHGIKPKKNLVNREVSISLEDLKASLPSREK